MLEVMSGPILLDAVLLTLNTLKDTATSTVFQELIGMEQVVSLTLQLATMVMATTTEDSVTTKAKVNLRLQSLLSSITLTTTITITTITTIVSAIGSGMVTVV